MGRAPCCDKANVKKGPWSPEEDAKLKAYIEHHGTGGNWIALPHKIGLKRCGKSCRLRWLNYLRPNIKHGGFSEEEDNIICSLYVSIGSRWSIIAAQLPGRTDNDIKNYWNTRLKKKLLGKQRKEQQVQAQAHRRLTSFKQQEIKTQPSNNNNNNNNINMMMLMNMNQTSTPPTPSWSPHHQLSASSSIHEPYDLRNLLTRLGGTFSPHHQQLPHPYHHTDHSTVNSSFPHDPQQHHLYPIICGTCDSAHELVSSNNMLEGFQNLEGAVLDQSEYYGMLMLELESSNMDMSHVTNGSSTTTTTSTESSSWGDMTMTSLLYSPTLVPEYQAPTATGITPQHVAFEESSSFFGSNHNSVHGAV